jgi:hypothetical protein
MAHGHISRYKRTSTGHRTSATCYDDSDAQLAANAKTAARLARDLKFGDAMKMLDRQKSVSPLSAEAQQQLPSLYPSPAAEPDIPSSTPGGRCTFNRHAIHQYVKSRSATSSPGISGFGFNWLQLFARFTVAQEDDQNEDPHWTVLVAFLEEFSCGELPWLRTWATELKAALFNKSPDTHEVKLRNLGIAETFVRIAAYMVMKEALPHARKVGLISAFDLGVAVPG